MKSVLIFQRYPMAVVGTAGRELIIYQLENRPQEFSKIESPLKFQVSLKTKHFNYGKKFDL